MNPFSWSLRSAVSLHVWTRNSTHVARKVGTRAEGEEMTEQEELIQDIRERLGEMPKRALPFNLLAFTITIGQRYSMTEDKIMPLVMNEADALGVNYRIG
jgi:hypothetical protein